MTRETLENKLFKQKEREGQTILVEQRPSSSWWETLFPFLPPDFLWGKLSVLFAVPREFRFSIHFHHFILFSISSSLSDARFVSLLGGKIIIMIDHQRWCARKEGWKGRTVVLVAFQRNVYWWVISALIYAFTQKWGINTRITGYPSPLSCSPRLSGNICHWCSLRGG